jgi:hypothetical protein
MLEPAFKDSFPDHALPASFYTTSPDSLVPSTGSRNMALFANNAGSSQSAHPALQHLQGDTSQSAHPVLENLQRNTSQSAHPAFEGDTSQSAHPALEHLQGDPSQSTHPALHPLQGATLQMGGPALHPLQGVTLQIGNPSFYYLQGVYPAWQHLQGDSSQLARPALHHHTELHQTELQPSTQCGDSVEAVLNSAVTAPSNVCHEVEQWRLVDDRNRKVREVEWLRQCLHRELTAYNAKLAELQANMGQANIVCHLYFYFDSKHFFVNISLTTMLQSSITLWTPKSQTNTTRTLKSPRNFIFFCQSK